MVNLLLDALGYIVVAVLMALLAAAWAWDTFGRREHEREEWRRGMAERLPRGRRGSRLWIDEDPE